MTQRKLIQFVALFIFLAKASFGQEGLNPLRPDQQEILRKVDRAIAYHLQRAQDGGWNGQEVEQAVLNVLLEFNTSLTPTERANGDRVFWAYTLNAARNAAPLFQRMPAEIQRNVLGDILRSPSFQRSQIP